MVNPDPLDLELWVPGNEWIPVIHEEPAHPDLRSLIADTARVLAEVGLGDRLRWKHVAQSDVVPGAEAAPEASAVLAGEWPGGKPSDTAAVGGAWLVHMLPGSVAVFGGNGSGDDRMATGARLTFSRPPSCAIVHRPLHRDRVVTSMGSPDRALERLVIEHELMSDNVGTVDISRPHEYVVIGRSLGIAWPGSGPRDPPFVLWTSLAAARSVTAPELRGHLPAVVHAGVKHLGLEVATAPIPNYHPEGWPPALDYSALLDPGERVALCITVIPKDA